MPLWKNGARAARLRSIGGLNLLMSAHLPDTPARPRSVTLTTAPVARFLTVYSGRSEVRFSALEIPVSMSSAVAELPKFGELWQVVQVRPPEKGLELKMAWPRATDLRATLTGVSGVKF